MRELSVCHLTTRFIKGGADFNIYHTMLGSAPYFAQTLVIGSDYDEEMAAALRARGISVRVFPRIRRSINPLNELLAFLSLLRFFKNHHFDIIHTHNAKTGILGRLAASLCSRKPIIVHGVHGMSFTSSMSPPAFLLFRGLERFTARRTDYFVSVGEMIRDIMVENGIGRAEQYRVINSGMDLDAFRNAADSPASERVEFRKSFGFSGEDVVVSVIARLENRKGQRLFLEAFASAAAGFPRLKALIVGDGPDRDILARRAGEPDLAGKVVLTGYRSDPQKLIAISDYVCLTSQWEGVPQSLVQAAAAGKPAVAFDVPGICEIVLPGSTGLVVPYPDIMLLSEALLRLAADSDLRLHMSAAAQAQDLDRFRIDVMIRKTIDFYHEITEKP